jgi:hypothetical protein
MLLALGPAAAWAEPPPEPLFGPSTWFGGKVVSGFRLAPDGASLVASEVEADARVEAGAVGVGADLDVHLAEAPFGASPAPRPTLLPPEVLFVRIGRPVGVDLRAGVTVPELGVECWDPDQNDFASYSLGWNLENGQMLGLEPGVWVADGLRLFAFAGQDLSWGTRTVGGGLSGALGRDVQTWSGGFWLPQERYLLLISGNQISVVDEVWVTAEIDGGFAAERPILGGQLGLTVDGGVVRAAVRVEHQRVDRTWLARRYDVALASPTAMTAALGLWARDAWGLVLEARERLGPGGPTFEGTVLLTARTPGEPERSDGAR